MVSDERLLATTISANRDGSGVLVIEATPPDGGWKSSEGCAFDISIPDAKDVTLKSSNGAIQATFARSDFDRERILRAAFRETVA